MSITAFGNRMVILDSFEVAVELMEKRSNLYSSRFLPVTFFPSISDFCRIRLPMVNELMGWDAGMGFMPYGKTS